MRGIHEERHVSLSRITVSCLRVWTGVIVVVAIAVIVGVSLMLKGASTPTFYPANPCQNGGVFFNQTCVCVGGAYGQFCENTWCTFGNLSSVTTFGAPVALAFFGANTYTRIVSGTTQYVTKYNASGVGWSVSFVPASLLVYPLIAAADKDTVYVNNDCTYGSDCLYRYVAGFRTSTITFSQWQMCSGGGLLWAPYHTSLVVDPTSVAYLLQQNGTMFLTKWYVANMTCQTSRSWSVDILTQKGVVDLYFQHAFTVSADLTSVYLTNFSSPTTTTQKYVSLESLVLGGWVMTSIQEVNLLGAALYATVVGVNYLSQEAVFLYELTNFRLAGIVNWNFTSVNVTYNLFFTGLSNVVAPGASTVFYTEVTGERYFYTEGIELFKAVCLVA
jgi:hypothetical protein